MATLSKESQAVIDAFGKQPGVTPNHLQALQNVLKASPALADQFNDAVANGHITTIVALTNPNAAGEYHHPQMRIPLASLVTGMETELTFVLGHELQHGFNHAATQQAYKNFDAVIRAKSKESGSPRDYTNATDALIASNRKDEAGAEIAGWNAIVSRLKSSNPNPSIEEIYKANKGRIADFIDMTGVPTAYVLKSNLHISADMTMPADAKNLEGMGQNFFDKAANKTNLGTKGNSDYANYYGAWAIGEIERAERGQHPLKAGVTPDPVALDMGKLRFDEKLIEENGVNLGNAAQPLSYVDSGKTPPVAGLFQHTASTHTHVLPISAQLYEDSKNALLRDPHKNPLHPDHALGAQVRAAVERLDHSYGRRFDAASERISASLLLLAKQSGLTRFDEVALSQDGSKLFVMQGQGLDRQHAHMPVMQANGQSVAETYRQLETFNQEHAAQAQQQAQFQQSQQMVQQTPASPGMTR